MQISRHNSTYVQDTQRRGAGAAALRSIFEAAPRCCVAWLTLAGHLHASSVLSQLCAQSRKKHPYMKI